MTEAKDLGAMTVSILRGEDGRQRREVEQLVRWLQTQPRPDVVIVSNAMLAGIVRRLREALQVPVVATLQGEAPFLDGLAPPDREVAWSTLRSRARDVDAWVAVSASYGDEMRRRLELPRDRVRVVHNGIAVDDFAEAGAPPTQPTVGYLARMCRDKGSTRWSTPSCT